MGLNTTELEELKRRIEALPTPEKLRLAVDRVRVELGAALAIRDLKSGSTRR